MEAIEERAVAPESEEHACVVALYEEAFPPEERFDIGLLDDLAEREHVDFTAYYRREEFCGFSYSIDTGSCLYVLFLAVAGAKRSRGHGSQIIARLKERYPGRAIVVEIEPIDPMAPNAAQRLARLDFYTRNGFSPAGLDSIEGDMVYTVLVFGGPFEASEFAREVTDITEGKIPVELVSAL